MELTELKSMWNILHEQPNDQITLNKKLLKESSVNSIKSALGEFKLENYIELIICILFTPYLIRFIISYGESMIFLIPAVIVLLVTVATIIWNIHNLYNAISLNYDETITQLHKKITRLQLSAKLEKNALYVLMPVLSYCFLVLLIKSIFNIDIHTYINMYWLYNGISIIAATIFIVWLLKRYPDKGIEKAATFLKEIEEFEEEN